MARHGLFPGLSNMPTTGQGAFAIGIDHDMNLKGRWRQYSAFSRAFAALEQSEQEALSRRITSASQKCLLNPLNLAIILVLSTISLFYFEFFVSTFKTFDLLVVFMAIATSILVFHAVAHRLVRHLMFLGLTDVLILLLLTRPLDPGRLDLECVPVSFS